MNARQLETLGDLEFATDNAGKFGITHVKPMDCGGSNGSHHSTTLRWLADNGYAERKTYRAWARNVHKYRITDKGREVLADRSRADV